MMTTIAATPKSNPKTISMCASKGSTPARTGDVEDRVKPYPLPRRQRRSRAPCYSHAMDALRRDLDAWIPRLLTVYRQARSATQKTKTAGALTRQGPPAKLAPDELRDAAAAVKTLSLGLTRER